MDATAVVPETPKVEEVVTMKDDVEANDTDMKQTSVGVARKQRVKLKKWKKKAEKKGITIIPAMEVEK